MRTTNRLRLFTAFVLAATTLGLAPAVAHARPQPGPDGLQAPPQLSAEVTVDCDDYTDPIRIHVTNHTGSPKSVEITDGIGYGWSLAPGETRQGPVYFDPIEMDQNTVSVAVKEGPTFFSETIVFEHSCFGPFPNYEFQQDCATGIASVLFTNPSATPTWATVVYPPALPQDTNVEYVTHISPALQDLDVSPGETVALELYGDGHAMFNGDFTFDCPTDDLAPAPSPTPKAPRVIEVVRTIGATLADLLRW